MKRFLDVLRYEYFTAFKSKAFIVTTVIMLILSVGVGFFPRVAEALSSGSGGSSDEVSEASSPRAIIADRDGYYSDETLAAYYPEYEWTRATDIEEAKTLVQNGEYGFAVEASGTMFTMYSPGSSSFGSGNSARFYSMVQNEAESRYLLSKGLTKADVSAFEGITVSYDEVYLSKSFQQTFWFAYALIFVLYMTTIMYGQMIMTSVATEKSTKTMEILITSVKPSALLFGKVIGAGLAGLTQFVIFLASVVFSLGFNLEKWLGFSPDVGEIIKFALSSNLLYLVVLFFLLGFFVYAFVYAALGSTISRIEEASSVSILPTFLFIGAFIVSMTGLASPDAAHVVALSYVPFFSPMVMFMRMCVSTISWAEISAAIAINFGAIFLVGFLSARIYKVGVMMYGNPPKLSTIAKYVFKK